MSNDLVQMIVCQRAENGWVVGVTYGTGEKQRIMTFVVPGSDIVSVLSPLVGE